MKEELIRVLNTKLDDINSDIDALVELNDKIHAEKEDLSYLSGILQLFEDNDVMNFVKLSKEDFNKVIDVLDSDVKEIFNSNSCNYDGLVYLIEGINKGVSLTLTDEQKNAILYLINKLVAKKEEHNTAIEGYELVKNRYLISDVDVLKAKKENYLAVLDEINERQYVNNTDLLLEAMNFSELSDEKMISILKYLLEYNADIYNNETHVEKEIQEEKEKEIELPQYEPINDDIVNYDNIDFSNEEEIPELPTQEIEQALLDFREDETKEEKDDYQEFHFNDVVKDEFTNFTPLSFDNYSDETKEEENDDEAKFEPIIEENNIVSDEVNNTINENREEDSDFNNDENVFNQYDNLSTSLTSSVNDDNQESSTEEENNTINESVNEENDVKSDDLQNLFAKYNIQEDDSNIKELIVGDINHYEEILKTLKENNLIDIFKENNELLIETLLNSDSETILEILKIIKNDLSVDDDDYVMTTKIVVNTIPSIFIRHYGNYDNFIANIEVFKELDINLINLFDFSKEVFIANHDVIINNLSIVKKYDVVMNYKNIKYLLLLPNIGDRLDYYIESVYLDKEKNEVFDGINYINEYTAKLNVVTDETIKRLRYCSDNGLKVFGKKPRSLAGEITNLKVNTLDISSDYLNKFFNNEFAILTGDEVREYVKLIHNSSNVGNYDDELEVLNKYRDGLRYVIENINISYNKVLRNYSILRSYGIDRNKALHFAVCYNLVITKEEYSKLKNVLDELGGSW